MIATYPAQHACLYCGRHPSTHAPGGDDACDACGLGDPIEETTTMDETAFEHIEAQAQASARELLAQGWDPTGERYDLGTYRGDLEALEERLGRKADFNERVELEQSIRLHLGGPSR